VETFRRAEIKHAVRRKSFRAMRSFHVNYRLGLGGEHHSSHGSRE
jgi:hypothetical protein